MKFNLSKIKFSNNDLKSGIKIPNTLTKELAEFLGIMVGDGHVGIYKNKDGKHPFTHYQMIISGNIKDYDYYSNYVNKLIYSIFNIKFNLKKQIERNAIRFTKDSKALYSFLAEVIKIPRRKDNVSIPAPILNGNNLIKASFLRGYADADFSLVIKYKPKAYPVISGSSKSERIISQTSEILSEFGIENYVYLEEKYYEKRKKTYFTHRIDINGFSRVNKFLEIVGFSNGNKTKKYRELINSMR